MDETGSFWGGFLCGVFTLLGVLSVILLIWGHITVDTMADIETPTMYKVTVDGVVLMCKSKPEVERNYLALWACDGMPDSAMRIKRYLDLTVVEIPGE